MSKPKSSAFFNYGQTGLSVGSGTLRLAALVLLVTQAVNGAQELSLADVLARATDYVTELSTQLSGAVAEERYEQRAEVTGTRGFGGFVNAPPDFRRTLRSDYLLIQPTNSVRYVGFRDVFEVDGKPVRDREERLTQLFLNPSVSGDAQIHGILRDSARYNIGDIIRNFNVPTLSLLFLRTSYKSHFEFKRVADASPNLGFDAPTQTAEVWVIEYKETWPTTVIRGRDRANLPARGRFWIEPTTGRVLVSELVLENSEMQATICVRYESDPKMGHLVPAEMRERYDNRQRGSRVDGTATYTDFRRFQVQVEESAPFRD
jgi:hypothetical protein